MMRLLLLILLVALFPLRGFASADMQTSMGIMTLYQATMANSPAADQSTALAEDRSSKPATPHACCQQCNSCDLCHLLMQQAASPAVDALAPTPPSPESPSIRFASADVHRAHKPPLALI